MKTFQKISGLFVAVLMVASVANAGSSVNGAPGRSDFNKRKSMRSAKSAKPSEGISAEKQVVVSVEKSGVADELMTNEQAQIPDAFLLPAEGALNPVASTMQNSFSSLEVPAAALASAGIADENAVTSVAMPQAIAEVAKEAAPTVVTLTSQDPATPIPAPSATVAPVRESTLKISYGDVLTERQKTVLKARAEDLKLKEDDYDQLLSADEKERLDMIVRERMSAMASGE